MPRRKDTRACGIFLFGADWRAEPTLMMCSEGARLLWFELLLLMAESDERGFLIVGGKRPSAAQIAALTRTDPAKARERLEELEGNGVFSRDARGAIYSRRMVRDQKNRTNGALGGNPNLCSFKENSHRDNQNGPNGITQTGPKRGKKPANGSIAKTLPEKENSRSVKPLTLNSVPSSNEDGGNAPPVGVEQSMRSFIWQHGIGLLGEKNRSLVGKLRKACGGDDGEVTKILIALEGVEPSGRVEYLVGVIQAREGKRSATCGRAAGPAQPSSSALVISKAKAALRAVGITEADPDYGAKLNAEYRRIAA